MYTVVKYTKCFSPLRINILYIHTYISSHSIQINLQSRYTYIYRKRHSIDRNSRGPTTSKSPLCTLSKVNVRLSTHPGRKRGCVKNYFRRPRSCATRLRQRNISKIAVNMCFLPILRPDEDVSRIFDGSLSRKGIFVR